jgi:hypothetical protein
LLPLAITLDRDGYPPESIVFVHGASGDTVLAGTMNWDGDDHITHPQLNPPQIFGIGDASPEIPPIELFEYEGTRSASPTWYDVAARLAGNCPAPDGSGLRVFGKPSWSVSIPAS